MNKKITRAIVSCFLLYGLITIALTYPLPFKMFSGLAGAYARDNYQWCWSLWWSAKAWLELGTSPADLSFFYYPSGGYHPQLLAEAYVQLVGLPFVLLFGPLVAYNLLLLLSFALAGVTTYLLGYWLTGNRVAAFIGGLIFAFFPSKTGHAQAGHFAQIMVYLFPLYALSLLLLRNRPGLKRGVWCGLLLALSLVVSLMHVAYFLIPFTFVFLGYNLAVKPRSVLNPGFGRAFGLALVIALVLTAPFLGPFLLDKLAGRLEYLAVGSWWIGFSADLLTFFVPSYYHPLVERVEGFRRFAHQVAPSVSEHLGYLGLVPLLLACWGFRSDRGRARFWAVLGLSAALLSLGPLLMVGGHLVEYTGEGKSSYVVLPYALLKEVPFYEWGRTPNRLNETVAFCLAVLVCLGAKDILSRLKSRAAQVGLACGLTLIIVAEYIALFPFPVFEPQVPSFYREIAAEAGQGAVLDLPLEGGGSTGVSNRAMYYQTIHGHKIVNGYIHRWPVGAWDLVRFFSGQVSPVPAQDIVAYPPDLDRLRILRSIGIKYVVIHHEVYDDLYGASEFLKSLQKILGQPRYQDEWITAFVLPERQSAFVGEWPFLDEADNWYGVEVRQGVVARWMANDGLVWFYEVKDGQKRLYFTAHAWGQPHVQVFVNDTQVGEYVVDVEKTFVTPPVALKKGLNVVRFHVLGRCQEKDARSAHCLGMKFQDVHFLPADANSIQHPLQARLSDKGSRLMTFLGYNLSTEPVRPGQDFTLILHWRAEKTISHDYTTFVHLVDEEGRLVAQKDALPTYPTSRWQAGEVVGDRLAISVPAGTPAGTYELKIGMYLLETMERLEVAGDAEGDAAISLGKITITDVGEDN